jgi:hypothetical protein
MFDVGVDIKAKQELSLRRVRCNSESSLHKRCHAPEGHFQKLCDLKLSQIHSHAMTLFSIE